jgi:WD40 repeat protein
LLAYMLRELYQQAGADGYVTVAEYQELGGVIGALQKRAGRLADELGRRGHGESVLPILTKFAVIEGDAEPTSRRIPRSALDPGEQAVAEAFVDARLLTSNVDADRQTVVGVPHEALLRQWSPLREAIEASRGSLRRRSELERLTADWDQGGRDDSYLLRGARLAEFAEWSVDNSSDVEPLEREFLESSKASASRELEATRRSNRRLRTFAASLVVFAVVIGLVAVFAIRANQTANQQRDIAVSRQLIGESENLGAVAPETAKLKSLAAWRIHPSDEGRLALLAAASLPGIAVMTGHTDAVMSVAFSPDGKTLATDSGGDDTVRLWDVANHRQLGPELTGIYAWSVAFSPDGKTLATGSGVDDTVRLWDVASHHQLGPELTGHTNTVTSVAFSPDGKTLASGSWDKTVRLWDVASHRQVGAPLTGHTDEVESVAFSPDGKTLASGSKDKTVRLWDVAHHRRVGPLTGHTNGVTSVAFSPGGKTLASGSWDNTVRLWMSPTTVKLAPRSATPVASPPWRSAGTAQFWPAAAAIARCGYGMSPTTDRSPQNSSAIAMTSKRWLSAPTAKPWPAAARTTQCGCGMSRTTTRSAPRSPATPVPSCR